MEPSKRSAEPSYCKTTKSLKDNKSARARTLERSQSLNENKIKALQTKYEKEKESIRAGTLGRSLSANENQLKALQTEDEKEKESAGAGTPERLLSLNENQLKALQAENEKEKESAGARNPDRLHSLNENQLKALQTGDGKGWANTRAPWKWPTFNGGKVSQLNENESSRPTTGPPPPWKWWGEQVEKTSKRITTLEDLIGLPFEYPEDKESSAETPQERESTKKGWGSTCSIM